MVTRFMASSIRRWGTSAFHMIATAIRSPVPAPIHGDCLEGLVSGPAIQARFGVRGEDLRDSDPFWELEAEYLGAAIAIYVLVLSPARIVVGRRHPAAFVPAAPHSGIREAASR